MASCARQCRLSCPSRFDFGLPNRHQTNGNGLVLGTAELHGELASSSVGKGLQSSEQIERLSEPVFQRDRRPRRANNEVRSRSSDVGQTLAMGVSTINQDDFSRLTLNSFQTLGTLGVGHLHRPDTACSELDAQMNATIRSLATPAADGSRIQNPNRRSV